MSKCIRNKLIFLVLEAFILIVCVAVLWWLYSRSYTEYQKVTVTVISKDARLQLVDNPNNSAHAIKSEYNVTVNYKNVDVVLNNFKLYKDATVHKDIVLTLSSKYEHGQLVKQELLYP